MSSTNLFPAMNYNSQAGKVMKRKPISGKKTPYDRVITPPLQSNWINALVTKLVSALWNTKTWETDSNSVAEGGIEEDYERVENLHDDGAKLNQDESSSSRKSEILYLVEELLMLEHFSREDCDRLIKIINLRVEDYDRRERVDAGPNMRTTQDVTTEAMSSLPTIKEKYQIAEEKILTHDKAGGVNRVEGTSDMIKEYAQVSDVIYASQGSSNSNDPTSTYETGSLTVKRATRTRKYNTRRGRPRSK
ncbi:hypothetical protein QVD17_13760 [Tagetes erecta]|uniref:Uncharacterized protein n=1 Tax=Tagetes erecta TaxID=13708 RepID=A0AAD8L2J6_TARER|nr:hypothetical protein QVD17_13760 [Tagetes erecta]